MQHYLDHTMEQLLQQVQTLVRLMRYKGETLSMSGSGTASSKDVTIVLQ